MSPRSKNTSLPDSPGPQSVREELSRVLASTHFQRSARLRRFLEFVAERTLAGESDRLKEYRIGVDVFGRTDSYDPRLDPVVRVEARRLRAKLASYYEHEGAASDLRIIIPTGTYAPVFATKEAFEKALKTENSLVSDDARLLRLGSLRVSWTVLLTLVAVGILFSLAASGVFPYLHRTGRFEAITVRKINLNGKATEAAISPDGKFIVSVLLDRGQQSLWVRNMSTGHDIQIFPPQDVRYLVLRFSRDGTSLYFVRVEEPNGTMAYLYRVPVTGGQPLKLISDITSNISFSPDGRRFAYIGYNQPTRQFKLVIAYEDGSAEKNLLMAPVNTSLADPAWSPDGKTIVCTANPRQMVNVFGGLLAIDVASGKQGLFFQSQTARLSKPAWLPDGRGLLVLMGDQSRNFANQIEFVSYPQGESRAVTHDSNNYADLSLTTDGHTLVAVLSQQRWALFVATHCCTDNIQTRQVTFDTSIRSFSWTPDNKLVISQESGLSLLDPKSDEKIPIDLPKTVTLAQPAVCPDGSLILSFFEQSDSVAQSLWHVLPGSTKLERITHRRFDRFPTCGPGSNAVYYEDATKDQMWMAALDGSQAHAVTEREMASCDDCSRPFDISVDGKLAVLHSFDEASERIALLQLGSHAKPRILDFQEWPDQPAIRFTPKSDGVVYAVNKQGAVNLWVQSLRDKRLRQLTHFPSEGIHDFQFSPDGQKIAITRGHTDSDVVLIQDANP